MCQCMNIPRHRTTAGLLAGLRLVLFWLPVRSQTATLQARQPEASLAYATTSSGSTG
jgi:hypothetical protein